MKKVPGSHQPHFQVFGSHVWLVVTVWVRRWEVEAQEKAGRGLAGAVDEEDMF